MAKVTRQPRGTRAGRIALRTSPRWQAQYDAHAGEIALHMSHFLLGYLRSVNERFDGDLALVIVLGELGHRTVVQYFSARGPARPGLGPLRWDGLDPARMASCSASALARATGLPRETVRRKLLDLEARGWVERTTGRRVQITRKVLEDFVDGFNVELLDGLLETSGAIRSLLDA